MPKYIISIEIDTPEPIDPQMWGATIIDGLHPKCPVCKGKRELGGYQSWRTCGGCKGSGLSGHGHPYRPKLIAAFKKNE